MNTGPDNLCWADKTEMPNEACNLPVADQLGLCARHRAEIVPAPAEVAS